MNVTVKTLNLYSRDQLRYFDYCRPLAVGDLRGYIHTLVKIGDILPDDVKMLDLRWMAEEAGFRMDEDVLRRKQAEEEYFITAKHRLEHAIYTFLFDNDKAPLYKLLDMYVVNKVHHLVGAKIWHKGVEHRLYVQVTSDPIVYATTFFEEGYNI